MPVTRDITATYGRPRRVIRRLLAMGQREDRALIILMAACVLIFVAQWPRLSREAHLYGQELSNLVGGAMFAWVFVLPLFLYVLGLVTHGICHFIGGQGNAYGARLALFWALLASAPLALLSGLVAGFIGPGTQYDITASLWLACFAWFWLAGLFEAHWGEGAHS